MLIDCGRSKYCSSFMGFCSFVPQYLFELNKWTPGQLTNTRKINDPPTSLSRKLRTIAKQ